MARFFIDRPVFAMVIAIVTIIVGAVAIPNLPIATYPQVVPPVVQIIAVYRGGNAQDLEKTVAQPIEQRLVASMACFTSFHAPPTTARSRSTSPTSSGP